MKIKLKDNIQFDMFSVLTLSEDRYDDRAFNSFKVGKLEAHRWSEIVSQCWQVFGEKNVHYYTDQEFNVLFEEDLCDDLE